MKIYKVCHSTSIIIAGTARPAATDFVDGVRVFTSKRRAINYATQCMRNYCNYMDYRTRGACLGGQLSLLLR